MNKSIYSRKTKAFDMPTKWLFFYLFIRFPLFFLSFTFSFIRNYGSILPLMFSSYTPPSLYLALLLDVFHLVLGIITFVKLLRLTPSSFKWNLAYLWYGAGYEILACILVATMGNGFSPYLLGRIVGAFLWTVLNVVYFNNRSALFDMELPAEPAAYAPHYGYAQQPYHPDGSAPYTSASMNAGYPGTPMAEVHTPHASSRAAASEMPVNAQAHPSQGQFYGAAASNPSASGEGAAFGHGTPSCTSAASYAHDVSPGGEGAADPATSPAPASSREPDIPQPDTSTASAANTPIASPGQPSAAASAPTAKFCAHCGSPLVPNAKFCNRCGFQIPVENREEKEHGV